MGSKISNKSMYLNKEYMDQKMYLLFSVQNDPRNMLQALDCVYVVLPRLLWVGSKIGNKSMYLDKEYMDQKIYLLFSAQNDLSNMLQVLIGLLLTVMNLQ